MATRAQLSQERSRLRRDELLAAAIELFAEGGSRAITHRAVAARAGLPPATTTYYFESIDDLIREALGEHLAHWTSQLKALTQLGFDGDMSLDDVARFIAHVFAVRGPEIAGLELAIFLAAARTPELRESSRRSVEAFESFAVATLERVGVQEPESLSAAIVALLTGTAMRRQSGRYSEQEEALLLTTAIRNLVASHVLGTEAVDRALAKIHPHPL
ncbi:TetR/AcrR family transcriptional regulator [Aeromicrobium sp.]|uniref:TetR/AcrR family transcriptional regulator n=1 Tax=Aeromicrobium sp. TaxID=1871063 RepID=UPI003C5C1E8A